MTVIIISIAVIAFIGVILYLSSQSKPNHQKNNDGLEQAQQVYEAALNQKDRKLALAAGRIYYSLLKKNRSLGMYEELAIANDLSTMPLETYTSDKHL